MPQNRCESDNLNQNYAEYMVEAKCEGKRLLLRISLISAIFLLAAFGSLFILKTIPTVEVVFLLLLGILYWYLSRFTNAEFEYIIAGAEINLDVIYGSRQRKHLLTISMDDVIKIAPYNEKNKPLADDPKITNRIYACTSSKDKNLYFILYKDKAKGNSIVFINVIKKTLKVFKYYRPSLVEIGEEFKNNSSET